MPASTAARKAGAGPPTLPDLSARRTCRTRPKKLTDYELGFKTTFWEQRARLNGSLFYYDYKDYQGFFLYGTNTVVRNVDAKDKGGELELTLVPLQRLNLQLGGVAPGVVRPEHSVGRGGNRERSIASGAALELQTPRPTTSGRCSAARCRRRWMASGTACSTWSSRTRNPMCRARTRSRTHALDSAPRTIAGRCPPS